MSEEQNKFDDIIRSKFAGQEFPFSEENWEKAERILDSGRKRKKVLRYGLLFLAGLLAGIIIMLPFVNNDKQSEDKMIAQVQEKQKKETHVVKETSKENFIAKDEQAVAEAKNTSEEKTVQQNKKTSATSPEKTSKTEKHNISVSLNENIFADASNKKKEKSEQNVSLNSETQPHNGSTYISIKGNSKTDSAFARKKQEEKTEEKEIVVPEIQSENSSSSILIGMNIKSDSSNENKIKTLQNKIDSLAQVIASGFAKDSAKTKKDSSVTTHQEIPSITAIQTPPQSLSSINIFSIDAGTNYILGWNYGSETEGKGFNPVLGFGLTHFFNPHWSVQTGIQYGSIAHLSVSTKTFTTSTPDFGLNNVDSIIDTKWIHYAVVPIFIQHHFNNKNSIGIGGTVSYLVNTTSNFIVNSYGDYKNPVHTEKKTFGYTKGFNQWNATLSVAYRRRISDKFIVSAEAHYGLLDIKDNTFFSKQKFERSTGIKLIISYDIFK
ncbi:MAG: PorT family protein [Bacteroidetes bacterium]|nr:PorT family protein [Bacteroidota bacterium]